MSRTGDEIMVANKIKQNFVTTITTKIQRRRNKTELHYGHESPSFAGKVETYLDVYSDKLMWLSGDSPAHGKANWFLESSQVEPAPAQN